VSIDELTGVQALEKIAPPLPIKPGHVERQEFEYRRHGTQTLIASFDVATGQVRGTVGERRTEQDFARFLEDLLAYEGQNPGHAGRHPSLGDRRSPRFRGFRTANPPAIRRFARTFAPRTR
jgi:hypothetical protein